MRVVLAYSGGLDTSVILVWLQRELGAEVVTYTADVGQGEEVEAARAKALEHGAVEAMVEDLRAEFARDFLFPALRADAVYEGYYLLGTALARPLIAKGLVTAAAATGAGAICHGATGKGNDQVRFELSAYALNPSIEVIAPWRQWELGGRSDLLAYAAAHDIDVEATAEKPYSIDANLIHTSFEGGVLEDPWEPPPKGMFRRTVDPEEAPFEPEWVEVSYEAGDPVAVDGEALDPLSLVEHLNEIGGRHGVGRVDIVENRFVGIKSRGVYESPGTTLLHHAHRAVESITLDREVAHLLADLGPRYARLVYNGFWFAPERLALQGIVDDAQQQVGGDARIKLYKGTVAIDGRRSENSLYNPALATFEADTEYDQADAAGFIRIQAHRLRNRRR
jgi:argininosuccinate synthase